MPYKAFKRDEEYCVYKINADSQPVGDTLGCHPTKDEADKQVAALYAKEEKALLNNAIASAGDAPPSYKAHKEVEPEIKGLHVWKADNGQWRWLARYSNSFRDDDWPVKELISSNSHKRFVKMVDNGTYPMPQLWLWHQPEWKWGEATYVAFDEVQPGVGFAIAGGIVDKGKEWIAEAYAGGAPCLVSHGMPVTEIVRDKDDLSIYLEHQTIEISPVPVEKAANKLTGFTVFKGESDMALSNEKRLEQARELGASETQLQELEKMNEQDAQKAIAALIEAKEKGQEKETQPEPKAKKNPMEDNPDEEEKEPQKKEAPNYVTVDAFDAAVKEIIAGIKEVSQAQTKQIAELNQKLESFEAKAKKEKEELTPAASIFAQITGKSLDDIKKEMDKAKGPEEAKEEKQVGAGATPSTFVNQMIAASRKGNGSSILVDAETLASLTVPAAAQGE